MPDNGPSVKERARQEAVLEFLGRRPGEPCFVSEIADATDISYGNLYLVLAALERDGRVYSDWQEMAQPRRRVYWVNGEDPPKGPQQLISEGKDRLAGLRARMDQERARRRSEQ